VGQRLNQDALGSGEATDQRTLLAVTESLGCREAEAVPGGQPGVGSSGYGIAPVPGSNVNYSLVVRTDTETPR